MTSETPSAEEPEEKVLTPLTAEQRKLIEDNIGLAQFLAHKQGTSYFTRDEILSHCYIGLTDAARRWRPHGEERGYSEESIASGEKFSLFARKRIIGAVLNARRGEDHVHPLVRARYKRMLEKGYLGHNVAGSPSLDELSKRTDLPVSRIIDTIKRVEVTFVSQDDMDDWSKGSLVSDQDVESSTVVSLIQFSSVKVFDNLPTTDQVVIALRYYEGKKFQEIAVELGITPDAVSTIHRDAVLAIHAAMERQAQERKQEAS